jgi:hypothetical protein
MDESETLLSSWGCDVGMLSTSSRCARRSAWMLSLLAASAASGCVVYSNGRPVGLGALESLANTAGISPAAHGCGQGACECQPELLSSAEPVMPECGSGGNCSRQPCGALTCNHSRCGTAQAALIVPRQAFASAANFCIRPIAYAPAEVPPPGRFHPVPTQPVFSPR